MSLVLAGAADSITYVLDAAPATNQLPASVYYALQGGAGNQANTLSAGVTPVVILTGSGAGAIVVNSLVIPNRDTATRIVTVNMVTGSGTFEQVQVTLTSGSHLNYSSGNGWYVMDKNGNFLSTVTVTGGTSTVNQGTANTLANAWPVEVTDGTNILGVAAHPLRVDPTGTTTQPVSGTVSATQGTTPWTDNISQWGGSATTLGQKVSASSVPVVIASDQSLVTVGGAAIEVATQMISGTTAANLTTAPRTVIRSLNITSNGAVLAAGSVFLMIKDGSGTVILTATCPTAVTTATNPYLFVDHQNIAFPMVNAGVRSTVVLSANLTSGSFIVSVSSS